MARSFVCFYDEHDDQNQRNNNNNRENDTDPLPSCFLMNLSFNNFFMRVHYIIFGNLHVLVGPDKLGALLRCVLLQLASNLVDIVHEGLGHIENLLSLCDDLWIEIDLALDSDSIFINLHLFLVLSLFDVIIDAWARVQIYWVVSRP